MTSVDDVLVLAGEFPTPTREQWLAAVAATLTKGKPGADPDALFEKVLVTTTYDGIRVGPLATAAADPGLPGQAPFTRGAKPSSAGWDIRQRHAWPAATDANTRILADLEGGVTSVLVGVGGTGFPPADLAVALDGVLLGMAGVALEHLGSAYEEHLAAASALLDLLEPVASQDRSGCLGLDPTGLLARTGAADTAAFWDGIVGLLPRVAPGVTAVVADGMPFHNAGGSDGQVLGLAVAAYATALRELTDRGVEPVRAATAVSVHLPATSDQFATIALLRAARRLLGQVSEVAGAGGVLPHLHAIQGPMQLTRRDPWVNLLRATVSGFAAGVGGADSVTTHPFDAALGQSDELALRIARNTQLLLLEESHVGRVTDPAGGSYAVEQLTGDLAAVAWGIAQATDTAGLEAGLRDGSVLALLTATWERKLVDNARRRTPITGVSEFPLLTEEIPSRAPGIVPALGGLPTRRPSGPWEDLRDASDAAVQRPSVVLLTLGPVSVHTGRVTFASNLYAAGGIAAPTATIDELPAALKEHATTVVCLCSSDKLYESEGAAAVTAARAAGATHVVLAGKAPAGVDVDSTVTAGVDALSVLRTTLELIGVQA